MSSWILLAIGAQVVMAIVTYVDRHVLTNGKAIGTPVAYAFYVALLSGVVVVLLPFGVISAPSLVLLELSCAAAAAFIISLLLLYRALKESRASDVMPLVAACSALTSFVLAHSFLDENLPPYFILAVALFIIGTFLISRYRFQRAALIEIIAAGFLFGLAAFLFKLIFLETTFWDGFFWTRMANVIGAFLLLAWPGNARAILHGARGSSRGMKWVVLGNKTLAGISAAMTFFAISLGSVSVVNAMSGLQFAFLLGLAYFFAPQFPSLKGDIEKKGLTHKLWGVALIMLGIASLYLA